jgi:hypothetical protein
MKNLVWYAAGRIQYSRDRFGLISCDIMQHTKEPRKKDAFVINSSVDGVNFGYSGPFTISDDHGCAHIKGGTDFVDSYNKNPNNMVGFGSSSHGSCTEAPCIDGQSSVCGGFDMDIVFNRSINGIKLADCVFAWFEDLKAYGTLFELGFAHALGKNIFIGHSSEIKKNGELWFALKSTQMVSKFNSAKEAFSDAIKFAALEQQDWQ